MREVTKLCLKAIDFNIKCHIPTKKKKMSVKSFLLLLLFTSNLSAQNLVPYQVQDLKNWDEKALWGYKDLDFKDVTEPINEEPILFTNGYAKLLKDNKVGIIDSTGKIVLEPIFRDIDKIIGEYAEVYDSTSSSEQNYIISVKTKQKFDFKKTSALQHVTLSDIPNVFITYTHDKYLKKILDCCETMEKLF